MEAVALGALAAAGLIAVGPEVKHTLQSHIAKPLVSQIANQESLFNSSNPTSNPTAHPSTSMLNVVNPPVFPRFTESALNRNHHYGGHLTKAPAPFKNSNDYFLHQKTGTTYRPEKREVLNWQNRADVEDVFHLQNQRDRQRAHLSLSTRQEGVRPKPIVTNAKLPAGAADRIVPPHNLVDNEAYIGDHRRPGGRDSGSHQGLHAQSRFRTVGSKSVPASGGGRNVGDLDTQMQFTNFNDHTMPARMHTGRIPLSAPRVFDPSTIEDPGRRRREHFGEMSDRDNDGEFKLGGQLRAGHTSGISSSGVDANKSVMELDYKTYKSSGRTTIENEKTRLRDFENKTQAVQTNNLGNRLLSEHSSRLNAGGRAVHTTGVSDYGGAASFNQKVTQKSDTPLRFQNTVKPQTLNSVLSGNPLHPNVASENKNREFLQRLNTDSRVPDRG